MGFYVLAPGLMDFIKDKVVEKAADKKEKMSEK